VGASGGEIIANGTLEEVSKMRGSNPGIALREAL
jgi:hypothetical protein